MLSIREIDESVLIGCDAEVAGDIIGGKNVCFKRKFSCFWTEEILLPESIFFPSSNEINHLVKCATGRAEHQIGRLSGLEKNRSKSRKL
jgi:hypothetical protein